MAIGRGSMTKEMFGNRQPGAKKGKAAPEKKSAVAGKKKVKAGKKENFFEAMKRLKDK